eukprot:m.115937 g.115937  ORF g.115937 m.115937 type:complete len:1251 (+) comp14219_c0_seq5:78-3830(+)
MATEGDGKVDIPAVKGTPQSTSPSSSPTKKKKKVLSKWTTQDVLDWVAAKGMALPAEAVQGHSITGPMLAKLDHEALQELGVSSKMARIKIITEVENLVAGEARMVARRSSATSQVAPGQNRPPQQQGQNRHPPQQGQNRPPSQQGANPQRTPSGRGRGRGTPASGRGRGGKRPSSTTTKGTPTPKGAPQGSSTTFSQSEMALVEQFAYQLRTMSPEGGMRLRDFMASKFLCKAKWDPKKAWELSKEFIDVYVKHGLTDVNPKAPSVWEHIISGKFLALERSGFGFFIFRAEKHTAIGDVQEAKACLAAAVYMMAALTESVAVQRNGVTIIYDMTNAGWSNMDSSFSNTFLELIQEAAPARILQSLLVNAPLYMRMTASFVSKLEMCTSVVGKIPPSMLPSFLGGQIKWSDTISLELGRKLVDSRTEAARFVVMTRTQADHAGPSDVLAVASKRPPTWFVGKATKMEDCVASVQQGQNGDFLIRVAADGKTAFLLVNVEGASTEFPIDLRGGGFVFAGKAHKNLEEIVGNLLRYPLLDSGTGKKVQLVKPATLVRKDGSEIDNVPALGKFATRRVNIKRTSAGESLGLKVSTVPGLRGSRVSYIAPDGLASKTRGLRMYDVILAINGNKVLDKEHEEVMSFLKRKQNNVELEVVSPEELALFNDSQPGLPKSKRKSVTLRKGPAGYGLSFIGSDHSFKTGIYVAGSAHKSIVPGLRLVAVNGNDVSDCFLSEAMNFVRQKDLNEITIELVPDKVGYLSAVQRANDEKLQVKSPLPIKAAPAPPKKRRPPPWYFGKTTPIEDCVASVKAGQSGSFLIRVAPDSQQAFIMVNVGGAVTELKIKIEDKKFHMSNKVFESLDDVVAELQSNKVVDSEGRTIELKQPATYTRASIAERYESPAASEADVTNKAQREQDKPKKKEKKPEVSYASPDDPDAGKTVAVEPEEEEEEQIRSESTKIPAASYAEHVQAMREQGGAKQLFMTLTHLSSQLPITTQAAKLPANAAKNRYSNVHPNDDTRVILQNTEEDYINANYVDGYKKEKAYIACQGPLPVTVNDLWEMIWQEHVEIVVMACKVMESGRRKCENYWPDDCEVMEYGSIEVTSIPPPPGELSPEDTLIRHFTIKRKGEDGETQERNVTQYHFTGWPDFGIPKSSNGVLDVLQRVSAVEKNGPILVHCSAGIGRTGTFITIDINLQMLRDEQCVDIFGTVLNLRKQRMGMVQAPEQLDFCYGALLEAVERNTASTEGQENAA